jgi:predicted amidohydrolase YtcJ
MKIRYAPMRRMASQCFAVLALMLSTGCQQAASPAPVVATPPNSAQVLVNADVVTMNPAQPSVEAIAWRDGKILAVGSRSEVEAAAGAGASIIDMDGKTVTPGFIETHSHTLDYGVVLGYVNAYPSTTPNIAALLEKLSSAKPDKNGWVVAFGFDIMLYQDQRPLTRTDLDSVRNDVPVFVSDQSGHAATANSKALEIAGITEATANPPGGEFVKDADGKLTGRLNGHSAMFSPTSTVETAMRGAIGHAREGFTTSTEGGMLSAAAPAILLQASSLPGWPIRIVAGFAYMVPSVRALVPDRAKYENAMTKYRFVKLWNDGSSQAGTALITGGYYNFPGAHPPIAITPEDLKQQVKWIFESGLDPHVHCNGDQATDWYLDAVEYAIKETGRKDVRPIIIHGQFIRPDQFDRIERIRKELGVTMGISFMTVHLDFWGDIHQNNTYGPVRAQRITAVRDAISHGIPYALHNDPPITPPDAMHSMWTAVVRRAPNGKILGPDQRISAEEALAGYTRSAAWILGMEKEAGTLEKGKNADFAILDANPLKVEPDKIKDIGVVGTVLGGRFVKEAAK